MLKTVRFLIWSELIIVIAFAERFELMGSKDAWTNISSISSIKFSSASTPANAKIENKQIKNKLDLLYEQVQKLLEDKPNVKLQVVDDSDILLSETGDNDHMELVEQRLHTLETKLTKVENKQKKITTIVNKLNKA